MFTAFLTVNVLLQQINGVDLDTLWNSACKSDKTKSLNDVCFEQLDHWLLHVDTSNNQHHITSLCPSSITWRSLVECSCKLCHDTWQTPDTFYQIWKKSNCPELQQQSINESTNLCEWIKSHHVNNRETEKIESENITASKPKISLKELESKMIQIISNFHRYKEMPTMQNIEEFLKLFHQIIDGIINLHITTTKDSILLQWRNNVTHDLTNLQQISSNLSHQENSILNGLKIIESKQHEMIENLEILQQLENHFNIPRAETETAEIFNKFKQLIAGIQHMHNKQLQNNDSERENDKKMSVFWEKGYHKLQMTADVLSLIANETNAINKKLHQYQSELDKIQNIQSRLEHDMNDDKHEVILAKSNEFNALLQEMRNVSKSQSYQNAIGRMERLSKELMVSMDYVVKDIGGIERKIFNALQHIRKYNESKFSMDDESDAVNLTDSTIKKHDVNIDDMFKIAWQTEMKRNEPKPVNKSRSAVKRDASSDTEKNEDGSSPSSGTVDLMTNRLFIYIWTLVVGAIVILFSFFMYFNK